MAFDLVIDYIEFFGSPIVTMIDYLGFFAPQMMVIVVTMVLWARIKLLMFYYLFCVLDWQWLNAQLKMHFKQPRPVGYNSDNSPTAQYETFSRGHNYGMPSGHASITVYSLTFLLLCAPALTPYSIAGMVIVAITLFQRFTNKRHTAEQLAAGAAEGFLLANIAYWVASSVY
jgi:membrane-associated phospholipid phosphatase